MLNLDEAIQLYIRLYCGCMPRMYVETKDTIVYLSQPCLSGPIDMDRGLAGQDVREKKKKAKQRA